MKNNFLPSRTSENEDIISLNQIIHTYNTSLSSMSSISPMSRQIFYNFRVNSKIRIKALWISQEIEDHNGETKDNHKNIKDMSANVDHSKKNKAEQ